MVEVDRHEITYLTFWEEWEVNSVFRERANGSNMKMGTDFEIFSNNLNISVSLSLTNASIVFQGNDKAHECTVIVKMNV